jgi:hypothetical protein
MIPQRYLTWQRLVLVVLAATAALCAHLVLYCHGFHLLHDTFGYYCLSRAVSQSGAFGLGDPATMPPGMDVLFKIRTYGYPLFVSACSLLSKGGPISVQWVVFEAQLAAHLLACLFFARAAARVVGPRAFLPLAFACTALNPWLLIRAAEFLTDSLSASLVLLALGCLLRGAYPRRSASPWWAALACLVLGFAVMVRPANALLAPALLLVWFFASPGPWLGRLALAPVLLLAFALPFVPQVVNNKRVGGSYHPLILHSVHQDVQSVGLRYIKYVTMADPARTALWVHKNPLFDEATPVPQDFMRRRPLAYAATCLMHGFFLFDQDAPFTYATKARPWYRWPSAAGSFAFLGLAVFGAASAARRAWARPRRGLRFAVLAALALAAAQILVLLPGQVECRFAAGVFAALGLFVAYALYHLWRLSRQGAGRAALALGGLLAFVAACCWASSLLDPYALTLYF